MATLIPAYRAKLARAVWVMQKLPAELRLEIYKYLISPARTMTIDEDLVYNWNREWRVQYHTTYVHTHLRRSNLFRDEFDAEVLKFLKDKPLVLYQTIRRDSTVQLLGSANATAIPTDTEMTAATTQVRRSAAYMYGLTGYAETWCGALIGAAIDCFGSRDDGDSACTLDVALIEEVIRLTCSTRKWYAVGSEEEVRSCKAELRHFLHRAARHLMAKQEIVVVLRIPHNDELEKDALFRLLRDIGTMARFSAVTIRVCVSNHHNATDNWHYMLEGTCTEAVWEFANGEE